MPGPSPTLHAARTAATRVLLQRIVRRSGTALSAALGIGAFAVLADRLIGPGLPPALWWGVLGALGVGGAAWAVLGAWARRPRTLDGAITADHNLHLQDALSSGLQLETRAAEGDSFAQVAVQDANAVATAAPIARATPIRLDNWWALWPALAVGAVALTTVAPLDLLTDKRVKIEAAERVAEKSEAEKALEEATRAIEEIKGTGADQTQDLAPPSDSPQLGDRLEALERLREQLASGTKSPDDARAEAARELSQAADAAAKEAQQAAQAQESASQALSNLRPEELGDASSKARQLAEALKGGDTDAAARAASDLSESSSMPPEARREESERLAALSRQLKELAELQQKQAESPREAQRDLERQGLSPEQARALADNQDAASVEEELRKRGFDEETAQRLADKLATERVERQSRQRAAEELNDLAQSVDRAASEKAANPPQTNPPEPNAPQPSSPQLNQAKPSDAKPDDAKPGEPKPNESQPTPPTDSKPAEPNAASPRPPDQQPPNDLTQPTSPSPTPPSPTPPAPTSPAPTSPPPPSPSQPGKPASPDQTPAPGEPPPGAPTNPPNIPGATTPTPTGAPPSGAEQRQGEQGKPVQTPPNAPNQKQGQPASNQPNQSTPKQPNQQSPSGQPQEPKSPPSGQPGATPQPRPDPSAPQPGGNQPQPNQPNQPGPAPSPQQQPPQPQPGQKPGEQPGQQQSPQQGPQDGKSPSPGGANAPPPGGGGAPPQGQPSPSGTPQPGDQPGNQPGNQSGETPGQTPGAQPGSAPSPPQGNAPGTTPGQGSQPLGGEPGDSKQPGPGDGQGGGVGRDGPSKNAMQSLKDRLQRMNEGSRGAAQKAAESRKLREQAEKMLDSMTPEQRKELEQLMAKQGRRGGAGSADAPQSGPLAETRSTPVDLRNQNKPGDQPEGSDDGEVLAEVNDPNAQPDRTGPAGRRPMQPSAQETLKTVQKAIEEKQLPARYRNVEKYFRRAAEQEKSAAPSEGQPAPTPAGPVKDAEEAKPVVPKAP
ncbi:MAG: hypothetical protein ACKVZJ_09225 [Phycisphaerales bacterium]